MAGMFDDLMSYLMGGTQMGNFLGVGSPTAATQAPLAVAPGTAPTASGPMLGGLPPPHQGLLSGLLGGQQPVNPMSYFQPRQGLLGDSPLGNMLRGGFAGLGSAAGSGGLTGMGMAAMGGNQAVQERQKQEMTTALAGQQYQAGQASAAASNITIAEKLRQYNMMQHLYDPNAKDLTYNDVISDPQKLSQIMSLSVPGNLGGQPLAGGGGGATAPVATGGAPTGPVPPTVLGGPQSITAPTGVTTNVQRQPIDQVKQALLQIEGGGDPNAVDKTSGAIGGLTQGTFNQYKQGNESFANPQDRAVVNDRILADLYQKAGGDVNRVAVGYFSGPGNMAPPGSPTPWINGDAADAHGTTVSSYVDQFRKRLMLPPIDAGGGAAQGQQAAGGGGQVAAGGQPSGGPLSDAQFAAAHPPYTSLAQYREYAAYQMDPAVRAAMEAEANKWDPAFIGGQEQAKLQGTQGFTYSGPQEQHNRAIQQADAYKATDAVKVWSVAKPAADAFQQAYDGRATAGGSNDYSLIVAALQVLNPGGPMPKPGTAEFATQLQTMPGKAQEAITAFFNDKTALPPPVVDQLKSAVDQRMAINKKLIDKTNESFDERAKTDNLQVPRSYWNPEGYGFEDQGGSQATGGQATGGQAQTQTQSQKPSQWTKDNPATLGAGATEQAKLEWFDHLPLGSVYVVPDGQFKGQLRTKTVERSGKQ